MEHIELFDVYQGSQIEAGKKSVAFSVTLRSADSTLTDEISTGIVNIGYGCAMSLVTSVIMTAAAVVYSKLSNKMQNMY